MMIAVHTDLMFVVHGRCLFVTEATADDLCGSELPAFHLWENTLSRLTQYDCGLLAPTGPLL